MSQNVQCEIICFYVAAQRAWVLNSWDGMLIPKPFSRDIRTRADPSKVPPEANDQQRASMHAAMEAELERVRKSSQKQS